MAGIGEILVKKGLITEKQLAYALNLQKSKYGLLGETLVDLGFITEDKVIEGLTDQLATDYKPLTYIHSGAEVLGDVKEIPAQVLGMVPTHILVQTRSMPLRFAAETKTLTIAMVDPADIKALDDLRFAAHCR